jgi:glycosyltransferase involved in cell wall biosynthesis
MGKTSAIWDMNTAKLTIVQQYLSWRGHYRQYFENLLSNDYEYIYCAPSIERYPNSTFLRSIYLQNKPHSFLNFIRGRFFDSFNAYRTLVKKNSEFAHLIEFEPISFFFATLVQPKNDIKWIVTIHSVDQMRYGNVVKDVIAWLQRKMYYYSLRKLAHAGAHFVTHYYEHQRALLKIIGEQYRDSTNVINYPCPDVSVPYSKKGLDKVPNLLIYGQIREDKGIFEFLSQAQTKDLRITLAGHIIDKRILSIKRPNLLIINRFIEEYELHEIILSHDFMLLPYALSYSGGAGTLKDSLSFGLPVLASDLPIFNEIVNEGELGYVYKSVENLLEYLTNITHEQRNLLSHNAYVYAKKYSWQYMRNEYLTLYHDIMSAKLKT